MEEVKSLDDLPRVCSQHFFLESSKCLEQVGDAAARAELHEDVEVGVGDVDGDVGDCQPSVASSPTESLTDVLVAKLLQEKNLLLNGSQLPRTRSMPVKRSSIRQASTGHEDKEEHAEEYENDVEDKEKEEAAPHRESPVDTLRPTYTFPVAPSPTHPPSRYLSFAPPSATIAPPLVPAYSSIMPLLILPSASLKLVSTHRDLHLNPSARTCRFSPELDLQASQNLSLHSHRLPLFPSSLLAPFTLKPR
eukprot:756409-Hanusia_phi.AAC.1